MRRHSAAALCLVACLLAAAAGAAAAEVRTWYTQTCPTLENFLHTRLARVKYGWVEERLHMLPRRRGFTMLLPAATTISGEGVAGHLTLAFAAGGGAACEPAHSVNTRLASQAKLTLQGADHWVLLSALVAGPMLRQTPPVLEKTLDRLLKELVLVQEFGSVRKCGPGALARALARGGGAAPGCPPVGACLPRAPGHAAPPSLAITPASAPPRLAPPHPPRAGRRDGAGRLHPHAVRQARAVPCGCC